MQCIVIGKQPNQLTKKQICMTNSSETKKRAISSKTGRAKEKPQLSHVESFRHWPTVVIDSEAWPIIVQSGLIQPKSCEVSVKWDILLNVFKITCPKWPSGAYTVKTRFFWKKMDNDLGSWCAALSLWVVSNLLKVPSSFMHIPMTLSSKLHNLELHNKAAFVFFTPACDRLSRLLEGVWYNIRVQFSVNLPVVCLSVYFFCPTIHQQFTVMCVFLN